MFVNYLRVKQYNSTYKYIIMVNNNPICITDSKNRAHKIIAYLQGYDVHISDNRIKKELDTYKDSNKKVLQLLYIVKKKF